MALNDEPSPEGAPRLVLGVPTRAIDAWILAARGVANTETLSVGKLEEALENLTIPHKSTEAYLDVLSSADLKALPREATQFRAFIARLGTALHGSGAGS